MLKTRPLYICMFMYICMYIECPQWYPTPLTELWFHSLQNTKSEKPVCRSQAIYIHKCPRMELANIGDYLTSIRKFLGPINIYMSIYVCITSILDHRTYYSYWSSSFTKIVLRTCNFLNITKIEGFHCTRTLV